jgi:glycerol-3-phosphate acyltransferase PlsY
VSIWLTVPTAALLGYLLGSIPVGLWVCRLYGVDIRTVGSGRTGGTNAWRAAGLKAAIPTVIGDAIKGAVAVWLTRALFYQFFPEPGVMTVDEATMRQTVVQLSAALAGGMAVIGHNWSIFNGFKGGAGGVTSAATAMAISPLVGGMIWIIGAFLYWWTRIASIATFSVGLSAFAIFLILGVNQLSPWPYIVFGVIALISVMVALRGNREKIRTQEERVISLW